MAIAMLMVGGILGVVIHFTGASMEMQSVSMMRTIASSPFQQGILGKPSNDEVRLPFFTVQISSRGELITASGGYFDLTDREYLQQIVNLVLNTDQESGELKEYDLRYLKTMSPVGLSIVFADTATEKATLRSMMYGSLVIFFAAMLIFLGISILLSRWVIKPVAKAWDQQRQFVADASHELKTPLAVIMANAELMRSEETSEDDKKKFSENILSTTYQMRSLVENMLEMARVDNGTVKMNFATLDLSELISDAVLSVQLLYEEKGMGLRCAISDGISIYGSEQHLYQVMDVLLDNALKYATPNGMVSVDLASTGRNCVLSVSSPGEPIPNEDLKNIFKRFYRGDAARAMNGSYGLGLSIAESIVAAHKGKIWAESKDGHNIFFVQLPLS
ncbi:MAG: HAMP domain-containing histidine kinase [Oscillospiraceae bacterium]|nr:HAMP domain-containing histidine kinase [Oscillospiraceae bacterium]